MQKEAQQRQEQVAVLQDRLDRLHAAQQEAEDEEQVLQQLRLACILPEEQQRETSALHHLSGLLISSPAPSITCRFAAQPRPTSAHPLPTPCQPPAYPLPIPCLSLADLLPNPCSSPAKPLPISCLSLADLLPNPCPYPAHPLPTPFPFPAQPHAHP